MSFLFLRENLIMHFPANTKALVNNPCKISYASSGSKFGNNLLVVIMACHNDDPKNPR